MNVVSYGGGTNSTAMLIGMQERGIPVDLILFADTGSEKPHTYTHVQEVSEWCVAMGYPEIRTVRRTNREGAVRSLEADCIDGKMLPSIAYGFKACSLKYKRDPQDKFCNNYPQAKAVWADGRRVTKFIGYDADEERRATIRDDDKYTYCYPLIEWGWGRDECIQAIDNAGLSRPGKSACFFCPSSKPKEIIHLGKDYPDLLERALTMESNAELTHVKGLGRNFAWRDLIRADRAQMDMFRTPIEIDCGCYDGEAA
jgi:hypothetical protein